VLSKQATDPKPEAGWLARSLQNAASAAQQGTLIALLLRFLRQVTAFLTVAYLAALLVVCVGMRFVGEQNITTAFSLYLPQVTWLLPLLFLLPLSLLFHRLCFIVNATALVLAVWLWMGYQWRSAGAQDAPKGGPPVLSLLTNNRGQHMNQSLLPFKNAMRPDLLLLQEASGRAAGFLASPDYVEFTHGQSVGEHTLLSRHPVLEARLLDAHPAGNQARAARFVIDWQGTKVSVYSVHLMTPRQVLASYRRGAFLFGVLGLPGTPWVGKRLAYQEFWDRQMADARHLLEAVQSDANPVLVAGDFNAPHAGHLHRMVTAVLQDAHAEAGSGFGFSFPGTTSSPLSLGGPWLRIDYVFHGSQWRTLECVTEPDRPSQHRAVFARMALMRN